MKIARMKTPFYTVFALLLMAMTSCTGQNNSDNAYGQQDSYGQPNENYSNQNQNPHNVYNTGNSGASQQNVAQNQGGNNIVMHPVMDPKTNQPSAYIPLPANWKLQSAGPNAPAIVGPGGIEVYYYPYQTFFYSNDQFMQQAYQANGMQMRPPAGIESVLNQDIAKMATSNGMKFIKQYPLPEVANKDKSYMDQLYSVGSRQNKHLAAGSEWQGINGNKVLIVTHYNEMVTSGFISWGYYVQVLTAKPEIFENAKNTFVNGLVNTQYNQQQIQAYNQAEANKANQSWAAHNQKMQNNQAQFEAQQRAHQSTVDAWNKSSMDAYNSRSASMDRMQDQTINSIYELENVTDPSNGQQYKVEGYSNQYWMNGQGEYIRSDNSLYNPNQDPNYNHQNWQLAPVTK